MILDNDDKILETVEFLSLAQKCIDVFIDSFTVDRDDIKASPQFRGYWEAGEYDMDKTRAFYNSKESKFRKDIKKIQRGLNVSIWTNFSEYGKDTKTYTFYYKGQFLFRLILYFEEKSLTYRTYKEITYGTVMVNDIIKDTINWKPLIDQKR